MPAIEGSRPPRGARALSDDPRLGVALLVLALVPGGWLLWEIHRTIGLDAPRFWELLREDRVFDLAMLDFFLTAGWALIVLAERSRKGRRGWRFWLPLVVFCAVPSVGIGLFLVLGGSREVNATPDSA